MSRNRNRRTDYYWVQNLEFINQATRHLLTVLKPKARSSTPCFRTGPTRRMPASARELGLSPTKGFFLLRM